MVRTALHVHDTQPMTSVSKLAVKNGRTTLFGLSELMGVGMLIEAAQAYAAGLFDGEGCVIIDKPRRGKGHTLMVTLAMREPIAVTWLQERWPGSLCPAIRRPKAGEPFTLWYWRRYTSAAAAFLSDILPYLLVKQAQAKLAIELQSHKSFGRRLTDEVLALDRNGL
jgi:hypothetical protein